MLILKVFFVAFTLLSASVPYRLDVQDRDLSDIRIRAVVNDDFDGHFHSELLNVSSGRFLHASFLMDYEGGSSLMVRLVSSDGIETGTVILPEPVSPGDTLDFKVSFNGQESLSTVCCNGSCCVFSASPVPFRNSAIAALRGSDWGRLLSFEIPMRPTKRGFLLEQILILAVILADLCLFFFLGRRSRRRKSVPEDVRIPQGLIPDPGPQRQSIFLFGDFKVISASGEDISSRFSPVIRDLLLLLVCNTPRGGITSERLESVLWYDKQGKSAANNRGVSTTKLRSLLKDVGNCRIVSRNGCWVIEPADTYIDYLAFADLLKDGVLGREQIESMLSIVNGGMFLADSSSLWSDPLKAEVSDLVISVLTRYAGGLDIEKNADTILRICSAVSRFDSLDETSLELKCRAYRAKGSLMLAHQIFNNYAREYQELYGQPYGRSYTDIVS